jgi:molybdopterin synthase sulfur carrier subunit
MVTVNIPTPLRKLTGGQSRVQVRGTDIVGVITELEAQFPGIRDRLMDETGELKRFINIYVNEEEIRALQGKATPVAEGDRISIVPAMAGG